MRWTEVKDIKKQGKAATPYCLLHFIVFRGFCDIKHQTLGKKSQTHLLAVSKSQLHIIRYRCTNSSVKFLGNPSDCCHDISNVNMLVVLEVNSEDQSPNDSSPGDHEYHYQISCQSIKYLLRYRTKITLLVVLLYDLKHTRVRVNTTMY